MSFFKQFLLFVSLFLISVYSSAQSKTVQQLEDAITKQNDALKYEASIVLISDFIAEPNRTPYEKYLAYVFKSYTYKRVFNYEQTLQNLNLALQEGLKSDQKDEVVNSIKAEKAFVYFDTHEYEKASKLMKELHDANYKYLLSDAKCWIIMQEGYLLMKDKKYAASEKKLDFALALALKHMPRNAANLYGKKVELYNAMKLYKKRDEALKLGIQSAKQYKIMKYEMYLYEVITNQHKLNSDYKSAFESQQKYDSLNFIYNSTNDNGKIQAAEKQIDERTKALELKNERVVKYFLFGLTVVLALLLFVSGRLYITNKQKRILVENENIRIHQDIAHLTKALDKKGNKQLDITTYNLTDRQKEIIHLIQDEKSNKEIATKLFISENTVKYHLKTIYEILNINGRYDIK